VTTVPLKRLTAALQGASPRSLRSVMQALEGALHYRDFVTLVRRWLPDQEEQVLNPDLSEEQQVWVFCEAFSERYFPIHEMEAYGDITGFIPVHTIAVEDYDYHNPKELSVGYLLLFSLAEFPEEGVRTVWLETAVEHVPRELVERIPPGGYGAAELGRLLKGTRHEGVALAVAYFTHDTGNPFLDVSEEWNPDMPNWSDEVVEDLTREWRAAVAVQGKIEERTRWLEQDPEARFRGLLDFIDRRKRQMPDWRDHDREGPGPNMTLAEVFAQEEMDIGDEEDRDDE
jgi:hypothetical protein